MSPQLQTILDSIQNMADLSESEKESLVKKLKEADKAQSLSQFKLDRLEKDRNTLTIMLQESIEDLQKKSRAIEAQNRELEIESSLEKVRTVAMGMRKRDDMLDICRIISEQLESLGIKEIRNVQTAIFYKHKGTYINYEYYRLHDKALVTEVDYTNDEISVEFAAQMIKGADEVFIRSLEGRQVKDWLNVQRTTNVFIDTNLENAGSLTYYWFSLGPVAIGTSTYSPLNEEGISLFKRFRNVFDLAYRRYLDIEKAEAQAREAQIETGLERVRSRSLAMHNTSELQEVIHTVHKELLNLNIAINGGSFIAINSDIDTTLRCWGSGGTADTSAEVHLPLYEKPFCSILINKIKNGPGFFTEEYTQKEKKEFFAFLFKYEPWSKLDTKQKKETLSSPGGYTRSCCVSQHTSIFIINHFGEKFSATDNDILQRFGKVFEQTYTRFLDLQKAEAQAKESQIQLALERVRARTMAMQKSDELADVAELLFKQVNDLGIKTWTTGFNVWSEDNNFYTDYVTNPQGGFMSPYTLDAAKLPGANKASNAKKRGDEFLVNYEEGEALAETYRQLTKFGEKQFKSILESGFEFPSHQYEHFVFGAKVSLLFITYDPVPEAHHIFKRFGKVFEQTYTRFLDLQKAEAQAKESQIQLALERVRARTMAMQHSDELKNAAALLFQQVKSLGVPAYSCGYNIWEKDEKEFTSWMSTQDGSIINGVPNIPLTEDANFIRYVESKQSGEPFFVLELRGERMQEHYQYLKTIPAFKVYFDYAVSVGFDLPKTQIHHLANFSQGNLLFITLEPCPEFHDVFKRFAAVFEQTYTRFLDLQKAEAQSREAQIELALERVRARTMAMQRSDELMEASNLLLQQVQSLGIPVWACGYNIWEIGEKVCTAWMSVLGAIQPSFRLPLTEHRTFIHMNESRLKAESFYVEEVSGEELADHYRYMFSLPDFKEIATKQLQGSSFPVPQSQAHHVFNFKHGNLIFLSAEAIPGARDIFKRFTAVFEQTYTRFLDLQKAEAQARESQIELGLERVRARAMAMQKSDELSELVDTVFKELTKLDFALTWCIINIIDEPSMSNMVWAANPDIDKAPDSYRMKFEDYPFHHAMMKGWKERKAKYVYVLDGTEKKIYDKYLFNETEFRKVPEAAQAASSAMEKYVVSFSFSNFGGLQTVGDVPLSDANLDILSRFGKVFDLTYTRFNDLKQAEAQAREAQIEAALEKVRSRSMGMQKSDELREVIQVVYEQFVHLNIHVEHTGFIMDYKERDDMHIWLADKHAVPVQVTIPYFDCAHWNSFNEAKATGKDFFTNRLFFDEKNKFYEDLFKLIPGVPEETLEYYFSCPGLAISTVLLDNVCLYIENFSGIPYSDEENNTLIRFGKVFQQTYTRFLDLQKAEEQAREAKIEAALENVRSRSLAMHHSNELKEVVKRVFEKMKELGFFQNNSVMIVLPKNGFKDVLHWTFNEHFETMEYNIPAFNHSVSTDTYKAWKRGEKTFEIKLNKEEKDDFLYQIFKYTDYSKVPDEFKKHLYSTEAYNSFIVFENHCGLLVDTFTSVNYSEDQKDVVKRFAKVFEQAYIRFLDLQKAEAQAREAKIETALEKVRSRTMAMQHSDELANVATVLFQQVKALGVPQWTCGFSIFEIDDKEFTWYPGSVDGDILPPSKIPLTEHPVFIQFNESRKRGDELFVYEKKGEVQADHYRYMCSLPGTGEFLQKMLEAGLTFPDFQIDHLANFSHGNLIFITYEPFPEMHDVFKRFAKVFEQTYTRFLDLKKAEAQALEAIKRASVDRIRAEIASMRTTNDLERITPLIWNELTTLGVPFVRCGVFIMDEERQLVETHLSTPDGKAIASFTSTFSGTQLLTEILPYWQRKEVYKIHWDEAMFLEQAKSLVQQGSITSGEKYLTENRPTDLYLHFLPFLQGMLYAGNTSPLSDDELQLMQNLADAFSTAYARYEDFNKLEVAKQQIEKTLVDLKQAQQQLVQSEKMASLGELTAGIAHEIQNPLNFVNNFSDVNTELVDELKSELAIGNMQLANEIADNIKDNEQKINHHGKRADAIVKNMLQHSRSSGAAKELTDINKLADEYLRLSYHGLRAKDKSFNADFKTELDSSVGKINVISQDIGRVLLNLINNAFYATNEKKKTAGENYKPLVSVLTKKINNNIEIAVTDNGKGIPASIKEKIFQPFFTTKPTGQGTGLGLSLSYDIVKAHGGEIRVESKEGEGSEFVIQLPV